MSQDAVDPRDGRLSISALFNKDTQAQYKALRAGQEAHQQLLVQDAVMSLGNKARKTGDPSVMEGVGKQIGTIFANQAAATAPEAPGTSVGGLRRDITSSNARDAAGLGTEQIAGAQQRLTGLQTGLETLGVPAGVAGAVDLSNAATVAGKSTSQAITRETQAQNNQASLNRQREKLGVQADLQRERIAARPAPSAGKSPEDVRNKAVFDLTKKFLPPTTEDVPVTTTNELTGMKSTKIVKQERPVTRADIRRATRLAERTVDKIYGQATSGPSNRMTPDAYQSRTKARRRAAQLAETGVSTDDATLAAISEQAGPEVAFKMPPTSLDAQGQVADPETVSKALADRLEKMIAMRKQGIGGVREVAPDDIALRQLAMTLLVGSGVPAEQIDQMLPLVASELKNRGL